jgi:hypothetical protein
MPEGQGRGDYKSPGVAVQQRSRPRAGKGVAMKGGFSDQSTGPGNWDAGPLIAVIVIVLAAAVLAAVVTLT